MDSKRQRLHRRLQGLKTVRSDWDAHFEELSEYVESRRMRFAGKSRRGKRVNTRIVDSTGTWAHRTLASGMQAGMNSPARPWFRMTTQDPDLRENGEVKSYLFHAERLLRQTFASSNIYNALHSIYADLGLFGTACALILPDDDRVMRAEKLTMGEFWIAQNHRGVVDTVYREMQMTVEQVVGRFVFKDNPNGTPDWSLASRALKTLWDNGNKDELVTVYHAVQPRQDRDTSKADNRNMPISSDYWEDGSDTDKLLEESGFRENPIIAPRWDLHSSDPYGHSPAMDALADIKGLQVMQRRKAEAIDKTVRPPMVGSPQMKNSGASLLPGAITYVDDPTGKSFRPAMQINLNIGDLAADIRETQERIRVAFFADLFMAISQMEGIQPRNELEIVERREEKLIHLGPVVERVQGETHDPLVDRAFAMLDRAGMLPEAPRALQGQELKIDYVSTLAQAQKAVSTGAVDRFVGFVGNMAGVKPDALDKIDSDQTIDEYAEMLGVPPSIVRSDDKVEEIRTQREQAMAAEKNMEAATQMASAAQDGAGAAALLSEASSQPGSAALLNQLGLGGA